MATASTTSLVSRRFADNFWIDGEAGYDILIEKLGHSIEATKNFMTMNLERFYVTLHSDVQLKTSTLEICVNT